MFEIEKTEPKQTFCTYCNKPIPLEEGFWDEEFPYCNKGCLEAEIEYYASFDSPGA